MSPTGDLLHHFLFERLPVRGHLVRLDASWRAAIEHHEYPEAVTSALGEAMAASALMAGALKFEGRLSLQFEGPGPVRLMLAQCTHRHAIRGVARYDELPTEAAPAEGLFGEGQLAVTIEQDEGGERYQGVVPLIAPRLAACLEEYFDRSEQLPSKLVLVATADRVAACSCNGSRSGTQAARRSAPRPTMPGRGSAFLPPRCRRRSCSTCPAATSCGGFSARTTSASSTGRRFLPVQLLARARRGHPAGTRRRGSAVASRRAGRHRGAL
jgi:hypothetical protein